MPCKFPGNFFAIKPNGGLILNKNKTFSFKPQAFYLETFDSFTSGQTLTNDGSFAPTLNFFGLIDSFEVHSGSGVGSSMSARSTEDSCNTFTCLNWDSNKTSEVNFECLVKWEHQNSNPGSEAEVFFINLRDSTSASSGISDASNRIGFLISKRADGDYQLYATDKAAPKTSLATISKSDIEYDTSDTNWIKFVATINKTSTSNRWDLSVKLYGLGPNGLDQPNLITSNSASSLYDNNVYNNKMYFQIFVYGFSSPSPIKTEFLLDNLKLSPLPTS
jgi:hypothetical protein